MYRTGSQNSVNPWMSLCSARVRFRDSANVSPSSAGLPKINIYFQKRKPMCQSPKWMKMQFSWGTEHWFMDQYYLLHLQFRSAHGKLMLVKLGGWCINLLTGFQHWVIFFFERAPFICKTLLKHSRNKFKWLGRHAEWFWQALKTLPVHSDWKCASDDV